MKLRDTLRWILREHWHRVLGAALLVGAVALIVLNWSRFKADFWPLDDSRVGPNLVASMVAWAFVLVVLYLVWEPAKKWLDAFFDTKDAEVSKDIKGQVVVTGEQHAEDLAAVAADLAEVKAMLDHVIAYSPDIPTYPGHKGAAGR